MTLELNGIDVDCIIGDLPEERLRTQRLRVDVSLTISNNSADSDNLDDTVDYAALTEQIRSALTAAECRMIERAAKVAYDVCMREQNAVAAAVKVTKSGAVPHLASASAVYPQ